MQCSDLLARPRSDAHQSAWFMTGARSCLYFFVLVRHSLHGTACLLKVAGKLKDCTECLGVWVQFNSFNARMLVATCYRM